MMPSPSLSTESFWLEVSGVGLAQGDYLPNCSIPMYQSAQNDEEVVEVDVREADMLVVTQSCDLENAKVSLVAMCPIYTLSQLKQIDDRYSKLAILEEIRRGKHEALHMLSSTDKPEDQFDVRIVDFREIHSLPVEYVRSHAESLGKRWRLKSPYLEHFSQAFARFFMRVGLPSAIQKFK